MAQTGFTPIITYHSTTGSAVPSNSNLSPGELALNIADMKLYCENSSGTVTLLASGDAAAGNFTTVDTTNLEVTNIKAKDGTAAVVLTDSTGAVAVSTPLTANGGVVFNDAGADVDFRVESDTVDHALFVEGSSGNVGIGDTSPSGTAGYKYLSIEGDTSGSAISFRDGGTEKGSIFQTISDSTFNIYGIGGSSQLVFGTASTERMRIDSSGNVGIDMSPAGTVRLSVRNTSNDYTADFQSSAASPYGPRIYYTAAAPNGTDNWFLVGVDTAGIKFQLRSNGGLANYSANNVNLSDERVKKDIADLGSQWNCIKEWNLVEFRYKEQSEDAPKNYGVIAQQIQEHCPEVVQVFNHAAEAVEAKEAVLDEDGNVIEPAVEAKPAVEERIGVREQQMLWMAVKALQEAMERIETLEAKVAALENA